MSRLLKNLGFQSLSATCAAEALELTRIHPVDVIICDMDMPGQNGAQVLAQVARDCPTTERILMSGYGPNPVIDRGLQNGDIGLFLNKPLDLKVFLYEVQSRAERAFGRRGNGSTPATLPG